MFLISIPKPCHENWDEMSPREQGAFCNVCSKTVVDFTSLTDEEVKNYFIQRSGPKTCGRFRNDQLTEPRTLPELLSRPIPFWKKFLAIVLVLFGSFLSGCQNGTSDKGNELKSIILGEPEPVYTTTGVTISEFIPDTSFIEKTVCTSMGFIEPAIITEDIIDTLITGDIKIGPISGEGCAINPIEITEEPKVKPDTMLFTRGIKVDSNKRVNPILPKVDPVKKITPPSGCDTLSKKAIEP